MALTLNRWFPASRSAVITAALAVCAVTALVADFGPPGDWLVRVVGDAAAVDALARRLSGTILQVSLTAFFAEAALTLLGAQIVGASGHARRLRVILSGTSVWVSALGACLVVAAAAGASVILRESDLITARSVVTSMLLGAGALVLSVISLLLEQRTIIDPYRLAPRLAGWITPSNVQRFGFLQQQSSRPDGDASFRIVRYNLDFTAPDPMGPITEVFWQGIRERDRVLLQVVADSIARQVCRSLFVRYRRLSYGDLVAQPSSVRVRSMLVLPAWRARRGMVTLLICVHYLVRHGPNAVRELGLESARDPWILSLVRLLLSISQLLNLRNHVGLVVRAIIAITVPVRALDPKADQQVVLLLPKVARHLWEQGHCRAAEELATHCGYLKYGSRLPIDLGVLGLSLVNRAESAASQLTANEHWLPQGEEANRWLEMAAELVERQRPRG
jgi:hypothetical protein